MGRFERSDRSVGSFVIPVVTKVFTILRRRLLEKVGIQVSEGSMFCTFTRTVKCLEKSGLLYVLPNSVDLFTSAYSMGCVTVPVEYVRYEDLNNIDRISYLQEIWRVYVTYSNRALQEVKNMLDQATYCKLRGEVQYWSIVLFVNLRELGVSVKQLLRSLGIGHEYFSSVLKPMYDLYLQDRDTFLRVVDGVRNGKYCLSHRDFRSLVQELCQGQVQRL